MERRYLSRELDGQHKIVHKALLLSLQRGSNQQSHLIGAAERLLAGHRLYRSMEQRGRQAIATEQLGVLISKGIIAQERNLLSISPTSKREVEEFLAARRR